MTIKPKKPRDQSMLIRGFAKRPFCNVYSGCGGEYKKSRDAFFPKSTIDYSSSADTAAGLADDENAFFENDYKF